MPAKPELSTLLPALLSLCLLFGNPCLAAKKPVTLPGKTELKKPDSKTPESKTDTLPIAYLTQVSGTLPVTPYFDPNINDKGIQGARLGIVDNNTTGTFTHQHFNLKETLLAPDDDLPGAFKALIAEGHKHILLNLPAAAMLQLADLPEARDVLLYDIASRDDALRGVNCRSNVLHLLPSRAMRTDALAQYFAKKRWNKWFLVEGHGEGDKLYAEAVRKSAKKFGAKIVADKLWAYSFDDRRTPESEVPVFTQGEDYDVLIVADEDLQFADFFPYRTWLPRPVAGSSGLVPSAWHPVHEMWGALQLQKRFKEQAGRWLSEQDYGAWLAVRAIGEAATRAGTVQFAPVRNFVLSEQLTLAGFKGVPLTFRPWDLQLRQPVLLTTERSLVAVAPVEGFLHPKNELDTLGVDQAESACNLGKPH